MGFNLMHSRRMAPLLELVRNLEDVYKHEAVERIILQQVLVSKMI